MTYSAVHKQAILMAYIATVHGMRHTLHENNVDVAKLVFSRHVITLRHYATILRCVTMTFYWPVSAVPRRLQYINAARQLVESTHQAGGDKGV